jgi:hypothetical protein
MVPIYIEQITAIVAKALAEDDGKAVAAFRHLLSNTEYARACARAVTIRQERDSALFNQYSRRLKITLGSCFRKIRKLATRPPKQRRRRRVRNK